MIVRFVLPDESCVEYGYGEGSRPPMVGEAVASDGSDPPFPAGAYEVTFVTHHVGLRGPSMTVCDLRLIYGWPTIKVDATATEGGDGAR